jgi:hypothetical protein
MNNPMSAKVIPVPGRGDLVLIEDLKHKNFYRPFLNNHENCGHLIEEDLAKAFYQQTSLSSNPNQNCAVCFIGMPPKKKNVPQGQIEAPKKRTKKNEKGRLEYEPYNVYGINQCTLQSKYVLEILQSLPQMLKLTPYQKDISYYYAAELESLPYFILYLPTGSGKTALNHCLFQCAHSVDKGNNRQTHFIYVTTNMNKTSLIQPTDCLKKRSKNSLRNMEIKVT